MRQVQCTRQVPKCPLFHLTKGFPHQSYLLLSELCVPYIPAPPNSLLPLHSSGCNERSYYAQEAVTEVFIKTAAIWKVARTGKSHTSAKQQSMS